MVAFVQCEVTDETVVLIVALIVTRLTWLVGEVVVVVQLRGTVRYSGLWQLWTPAVISLAVYTVATVLRHISVVLGLGLYSDYHVLNVSVVSYLTDRSQRGSSCCCCCVLLLLLLLYTLLEIFLSPFPMWW